MSYQVTPPTRTDRGPRCHPLFDRMSWQTGITVLKEDGFYRQVIDPTSEEVSAADAAYPGGRSYTIDSTERAALIAAGNGAYISGAP